MGLWRRSGRPAALLAIALAACQGPVLKSDVEASPTVLADWIQLSDSKAVNGGVARIRVRAAEGPPNASVSGTALDFYPGPEKGTWDALVAIGYSFQPGTIEVDVRSEGRTSRARIAVSLGAYADEILKVDPSKVSPKPEDMKRILREKAEVGRVYQERTQGRLWGGKMRLPIDSPITSVFGTRRLFNGEMASFHQGLDLKAAEGTPVLAAAGGKVALAKDLFFTGNTVLLDHGYGIFTIYAHLSRLDVQRGSQVTTGASLGLSGATGRVSGPHLHWGAVIRGIKVNPAELMRVLE